MMAKLPVDFDIFLVPQLNKAVVHPVFDEGCVFVSIQDTLGLGDSFS